MDAKTSAKNALKNVLEACAGENIIVICDEERLDVGRPFAEGALDLGLWTRLFVLDKEDKPRKEIPRHLLELLTSQMPDIFINLLKGGADETPFRVKIIGMQQRRRVRLGHCPGITLEMLEKGALALTDDEHRKMQENAQSVLQAVSGADEVHITTKAGTDFSFKLDESRQWFTDTKINWKTMKWMNLPTGETLVGPIEDSLNGKVVCDVAVGGYGHLDSPVIIEAKNGKAVSVECKNKEALAQVKRALATDSWSDKIGEFAFGLNPKARVVKEFLETEKVCDTIHIAFGNNRDYPGGKNFSGNHMDFLMDKPTVEIKKNGKWSKVMKDGKFVF